ncbi:neuraminidase-like domain-containing protein [Psychrobacter sp. P11G5]|uniref:Tc toxin subunit A-related protein n=1 Tax=Psychrobacter sp. P11G5 TaxID=1699624 RepID=UPI00078D101C|nr:neuraminidase-like domain-containing protein [Psychrobacter sp. P11G5]AMN67511.1 hypothetical protein AK825_07120 [Psychrobacter sp. P11G5]
MNAITFPLKLQMKRPEVGDLQDALRLLLERSVLLANDETARHKLSETLKSERTAQRYGKATRQLVSHFQEEQKIRPTGEVDELTANALNALLVKLDPEVRGRVTQPNGNPIPRARVQVIYKRLLAKDDVILGETNTDTSGQYEVRYVPRPKGAPDLLVRVIDAADEVVAESPLIIEAEDKLTVDIIVDHESYSDLPEFEQLQQRLAPFLDGTDSAELDQKSIMYLAGKSRVNPVFIAYLVKANRLSKATKIEPEAFYGLLRANQPMSLSALVAQDESVLRQALEEASKANVISKKVADKLEHVLKSLMKQRVDLLLQQPELPVGSTSLGGILTVADIDDRQKRAFAQRFAATHSTSQAFWDELATDHRFDETAIDSVKLAIKLGTLTRNNSAIMKSLHRQLSEDRQGLRGLIGRNQEEWLREIRLHTDQEGKVMLPPDLPKIDGETSEMTYARTMADLIEATYPTPSVAAVLGRSDFDGADEVKTFLSRHHNIELRDQNVRVFLDANDIQVADSLRDRLFDFKRVFDLAPAVGRYEAMRALLKNGDTSAYRIRKMGKTAFYARYGPVMGEDVAKRVYQAASQKSAMATALFAAYSPLLNNLGMKVLPEGNLRIFSGEGGASAGRADANPEVDLPTWEKLFGSISFCACEHCRSVYSPAAYLVDLLAFLRDRKKDGRTALEVLFLRRGDIGKIELNCHNTNTTLPYVDLVIEVMEHFLASAAVNTNANWWDENEVPQTFGEREDLRVHPENIVAAAYGLLQNRDYPWTLPFNLWAAEMRSYLEPLGVKRTEIMGILNPHSQGSFPATLRTDIAAEALGLIPREWSIIIGSQAEGLAGWGSELAPATIEELRNVKSLMRKGSLAYLEVRRLLDTKFVNANGDLEIEFASDHCDLDHATIPMMMEEPHADSIHRFMRLQRKLGWNILDLDAAIHVLGTDTLDDMLLRRLAVLRELHDTFGMPLLTLLSWWGPIDTTQRKNDEGEEQPSLYDRLFLNKSIGDQDDMEVFTLNNGLDELANTNSTLEDEESAILAALGLTSASELDLIIQKRGIDGALNLANLSELYRVVTMAKALRLPVADLLHFIDLTGLNPFALENLEGLSHGFLDVLAVVSASDSTLSELAYILNHDSKEDSLFARGSEAIGDFLFRLRTGLKKLEADYLLVKDPVLPGLMTTAPDPVGKRTRLRLAKLVPESMLDRVMGIIVGTPDTQLPEGTLDRNAIIDQYFDVFIDDLVAFKDQFINDGSATYLDPSIQLAERFHTVLDPLTRFLLKTDSIALVQQSFADLLDIDLRASVQLLGSSIKAITDATQSASAIFLDDTFVGSTHAPLAETAFADQYQMVRRLQKIALILNQLDIPSDEVRWLVEEAPQLGWLDLNTLPIDASEPDPERFQSWLRMAQFAWLRTQIPIGETSLFTLLRTAHSGQDENGNAIEFGQFITGLHAATGWNQTDIETLLDVDHLNLSFNNHFTGQQALEHLLRLYRAIELLQRLGVSAKLAWTWAAPEVTRETTNEVKQAARAKFSVEKWPSVAKLIRDGLRLHQRNTLVDAALTIAGNDDISEIAHIYAYFLMDAEMNPCMLTSRIKLAISSVQLFVQRCLMNLEPGVTLDDEAASQWQWMKNYRVWEANRKIFLYPENWIEPELRLEKSSFFEDLENELLQNDVTSETAETAFLNYLEKLDEVARLEVSSVYNDEEEAGTLYVLGRTKNIPRKYFYRRWKNRRRWTPWESVPVDIEGENVSITRHNRRLYLFWFMTTERADTSKNGQVKVPEVGDKQYSIDRPYRYLEIKLAWSQYDHGSWSPKKLSNSSIDTESTTFSGLKGIKNPKWLSVWFRPRPLKNEKGQLKIAVEQIEFKVDSDTPVSEPQLNSSWLQSGRCFLFEDSGRLEIEEKNEEVVDSYLEEYRSDALLALKNPQEALVPVLLGSRADLIVPPLQYTQYTSQSPLFYENGNRIYVIVPIGAIHPKLPDFTLPTADAPVLVALAHSERRVPNRFPFRSVDLSFAERSNSLFATGAFTVSGLSVVRKPLTATNSILAVNFFGKDSSTHSTPTEEDDDTAFGIGENILTAFGLGFLGEPLKVKEVTSVTPKYRFHIHYHPYVSDIIKQIYSRGIEGLLNPAENGGGDDLRRQLKRELPGTEFGEIFQLKPSVDQSNPPVEEFDFSYTGAYALYNWELFFHAPLLIASRLSANQQFEAAQKWFHYLFDPTDVSNLSSADTPYRYWKIKPFFENRGLENIRALLGILSSNDAQDQAKRGALEAQVADWRDNAFQPHRIAEQRLVAYQKTIVMKYLDNLINWGDSLFRRDSIESINEATQLYILASQILGDRPETLPELRGDQKIDGQIIKTFDDLEEYLDQFGNVVVQIENELPAPMDVSDSPMSEVATVDILGSSFFFCVPRNEKHLRYWDIIADRLFKVRNCMNTKGDVRQLSLFELPIDRDLLTRATAAGIDIGSVLKDMKAPRLQYRYSILVQKAIEFCNDVKQLGGALLAALEKRDAEKLALLRSSHEERLLSAMRDVRRLQLEDADAALAGLEKNLAASRERHRFYAERVRRISEETAQFDRLEEANHLELGVAAISLVKQGMAGIVPNVEIGTSGFGGSPVITTKGGLMNLVHGLDATSLNTSALAQWANRASNMSSITAGFKRRDEEWDFQANQAATEIEALEKQLEGARLRIAIAEHELKNQERQIAQNREMDDLMRSKFTNEELYGWMVDQIRSVYFQSYQLAYEMANRAQRAFQYELADYDASFINFGYWDNLKKGLLAGDQLHYDLRRMETAYLETNRREYELTRHVSLLQVDPLALIQLRTTGRCTVRLPESLFDMDGPGHYFRRIKTVAVSIPCVTGPYASVNCTLTLLKSSIRKTQVLRDGVYAREGAEDDRFNDNFGSLQSIVTSSAQNDSGLFETNLRDERYLPFENSGVVSEWQLQLPADPSKEDPAQFDYQTISDVILHIRYTAREGGSLLRSGSIAYIKERISEAQAAGSVRLFSVRHEFPTEWARFQSQPADADRHELTLNLLAEHYPFWSQGRLNSVKEVKILANTKANVKVSSNDGEGTTLDTSAALGNLFVGNLKEIGLPDKPDSELKLFFDTNVMSDLWVAVTWSDQE